MPMRRRPVPPVSAVLVALAAALVAGSCATTGDRVAILGDSITALGELRLRETLGGSHDLTIDGKFGARTDQRIQAATNPHQVIINLGTNDVLQGRPTAEVAKYLELLLGVYRGASCVFLVTINTHLDQNGNRPEQAAKDLNAQMEQLTKQDRRGELIRWDEMQDAAVDEQHPQGLTTDGVHPGDEGQQELAGAYADALAGC